MALFVVGAELCGGRQAGRRASAAVSGVFWSVDALGWLLALIESPTVGGTDLDSARPLSGVLIAAVMALGMNYGLGRVARSTPFSYRQLAWAADWHIREDAIRAALIELDQFVLNHPLARATGVMALFIGRHARQSRGERGQRRS